MGWLAGWSYRKTVTITGQTGAGTNYQVDFSIGDGSGGDFDLESHCTSFPNDIQVTDNDQTTPLDYWVEDLTVDPIKLWVEVADDLGSNVDICVYYGKSGESSASNGTNTFLQYHGTASSSYLDSQDIAIPGIRYQNSFTIPNNIVHNIVIGVSDTIDISDDNIIVQSYNVTDLRYFESNLNGSRCYINESPALDDGTKHILEILYVSGQNNGYIDGNEISTGCTTYLPTDNQGLHLKIWNGSISSDWAFASKYQTNEPAFSSAGSEERIPRSCGYIFG